MTASHAPSPERSPLVEAVRRHQYDEAVRLLDEGADINAKDGYNQETALIATAKIYGSSRLIELLLERGADIEAEGLHGTTPLMAAVQQGHATLAEALLTAGANVNYRNKHGRTPLHAAASGEKSTFVRLLLENGADPDAADNNGFTPLMSAAYGGDTATMKELLDGGASVDLCDATGATALMSALDDEDIQYMREHLEPEDPDETYDGNEEKMLDLVYAKLDAVSLLMERGADAKIRNKEGETALEMASRLGNSEAVETMEKALTERLRRQRGQAAVRQEGLRAHASKITFKPGSVS